MARKTYAEYARPVKAMVAVSVLLSLALLVLYFFPWFGSDSGRMSLLTATETLHSDSGGGVFSRGLLNFYLVLSLYLIPVVYLVFLCQFSAGTENNIHTGLLASVIGTIIITIFYFKSSGVLAQLTSATNNDVAVLNTQSGVSTIIIITLVFNFIIYMYDRRFK
jgi:hypothetical protein